MEMLLEMIALMEILLSRLATQPTAVINRLVAPEMALAFGGKDLDLFRRLFSRSCQFSFWGCLMACLTIALGASWIVPVWTAGAIKMDWAVGLVLLCGVLVNGIWYTALIVPYATNRHGRIAVFYTLVYGVIGFGLSCLWAAKLVLIGAAAALLVVECAMAVIVIQASLVMSQMKLSQWGRAVLRPPLDIFRWIRGCGSLVSSMKHHE